MAPSCDPSPPPYPPSAPEPPSFPCASGNSPSSSNHTPPSTPSPSLSGSDTPSSGRCTPKSTFRSPRTSAKEVYLQFRPFSAIGGGGRLPPAIFWWLFHVKFRYQISIYLFPIWVRLFAGREKSISRSAVPLYFWVFSFECKCSIALSHFPSTAHSLSILQPDPFALTSRLLPTSSPSELHPPPA